ncbi:hypothetical protein HPB47_003227 [Ixodes persulcatus]|uniref:Uncharacterized protein n=1 Tax=Ixodes persulcatus TaxID=34615 RepID=A0AC60PK19_IXOPE|nr:hypothetical protein HPB47_003227 [Ixodes persulcatus]
MEQSAMGVTEIEAAGNSRPLTFVYNEVGEGDPITPASFPIGRRNTALHAMVAPSNVKGRGSEESIAGDQITKRCSTERGNFPAEDSWGSRRTSLRVRVHDYHQPRGRLGHQLENHRTGEHEPQHL